MKKAILVLITSAFVFSACAQNADFGSSNGTESDKVMNLSADQIAKIKKLNREAGLEFKAIGQSNLSGYEKGQRKRALAAEKRDAVRKILTQSQIDIMNERFGMTEDDNPRDVLKDEYEVCIKQAERKYEKEKADIENSSLSKEAKKSKIKELKNNYKSEKNKLKEMIDQID